MAIALELEKDTTRCIALLATWARANGTNADVRERYNHSYEAHSLGMIHDALHVAMIMALMRMHDKDRRSGSIPTLLGLLDLPGVLAEFKQQSVAQREFSDIWISEAKRSYESLRAEETLASLRKLRNHVLAHIEVEKATLHRAKYGYEQDVLNSTKPIVRRLMQITHSADIDFSDREDAWRMYAEAFWGSAITSQRWEHLP